MPLDSASSEQGKAAALPPELASQLSSLLATLHSAEHDYFVPPSTCDRNLARFLTAKKHNVEQSAKLLRSYWTFRKSELGFSDSHSHSPHFHSNSHNLDLKHSSAMKEEEDVAQVFQDGFVEIQGRTRQGGLVLVVRSAKSFPGRLPLGPVSIARALWHALEVASYDLATQKVGITVVNDCRGAGMANADLRLLRLLPAVFTGRFPLRIARYFVLEPPMVFPLIWKLIRPLASAKLAEKMIPIGLNALLQELGPEALSSEYGGLWTRKNHLDVAVDCGLGTE